MSQTESDELLSDSKDPFSSRFKLRESCETFLYREAELLDDRRLEEWHELLTEDLEYRAPIRTTRERSVDTEFSDVSFHLKEDRSSLQVRVERMQNDFAWSEDPPSRTRRHVNNVRLAGADEESGEVSVKSNLLLYFSRDEQTKPDLLSAERHDTLRSDGDGWQLAERTLYFDHTTVPLDSLSIIL